MAFILLTNADQRRPVHGAGVNEIDFRAARFAASVANRPARRLAVHPLPCMTETHGMIKCSLLHSLRLFPSFLFLSVFDA